ncbi:leucine-rich repeat domain-containing protein [Flavobacterium pectinovorum]|uniref:Internalin A n=1 Tax=Flavobacterium pectinovorum TaxID=29533 RepID=A0AB36NYB0_9FLAO|nr:leucine-rich repeat domain-containing protein [Flavobacterium pectinovorum]OXB03264.1 hypothetical protein B0A72_15090 [Flavobacterium pectinovorum]SHL21873.1 internalin A [Flavobacterium pectinovorum]
MSLDKTIRENSNGKYLTIHANYFQEGIEYAGQIGISQIQLRGILGSGSENPGFEVNFKEFEKISKILKVISFAGTIENVVHLESIYSLENIEKISFQQKQKFTIDISKFPNIVHLGGEYWKGLHNIDKAFSLKSMVLLKIPDSNLQRFSELVNLRILHIYSSKIQSIEGIEKLPIEELSLVRNTYLKDIQTLKQLTFLKELSIEKCKFLTDFSFLGNTSIKELFIDDLNSIKFISSMISLEKINFWNCKDGDMTPLLELKSLKEINFYPNRKHYSHTIEEIIEITGARRGRNV